MIKWKKLLLLLLYITTIINNNSDQKKKELNHHIRKLWHVFPRVNKDWSQVAAKFPFDMGQQWGWGWTSWTRLSCERWKGQGNPRQWRRCLWICSPAAFPRPPTVAGSRNCLPDRQTSPGHRAGFWAAVSVPSASPFGFPDVPVSPAHSKMGKDLGWFHRKRKSQDTLWILLSQ